MSGPAARAVYTGFLLTGSGRVQLDFDVPATASDRDIKAAAWDALAAQLPADVLLIGEDTQPPDTTSAASAYDILCLLTTLPH